MKESFLSCKSAERPMIWGRLPYVKKVCEMTGHGSSQD